MLKIPSKASLTLSMVLSILFALLCFMGCFFLPELVGQILRIPPELGIVSPRAQSASVFVYLLAYLSVVVAMAGDVFLYFLLIRVKKGKVFTAISVSLVRFVSWCCLVLGVIFALLGLFVGLALIVALAAIFLGLCLRVVKNVIEKATEIKQEHDLTV